MKKIPLLLSVILFASLVNAQEDSPLITDRPDQTESALVVPAWHTTFQVFTLDLAPTCFL